jgi:taurine transport system substrate-binding protein
VQNQILQTGTFIVGADQTAQWGYPTFDGWVVNTEFAAANPMRWSPSPRR